MSAQTLQNPTFGVVTEKNNAEDNTAAKVMVQDANGKHGFVFKSVFPLDANVVHKTGNEDIYGLKSFLDRMRVGLVPIGTFFTSGRHLTQFVAGDQQTPIALAGGNSSIEYFRDVTAPRYAWATGLQSPSAATLDYETYNAFRFYWSYNASPYLKVLEISEQGNLTTKGVLTEGITEVTPTISGQPARIRYVNSLNTTQPVKLVIYFHGSGTNQLNPFTDTNSKYVIDKLLSEGYIVASSQAHGNAWGNQASQDDYLALYNYVIANYNINDVVFVGHSMGGITSLNMIAKNTIPAVSRWYGIMPATNLSEAYFTEGFASSIETAYGFTGGANYAAATAGNDPNLYAGSAYVGKKYTMTASPGDLTIIKTTNADLFNTKLTGAGISSYIVTASGVHGDISHFIPKHIYRFFQGITNVKASQNVMPRVDNAGDLVDSAILDDGVNLNLTRNTRLTNSTPTFSLINSASSNKRWDARVSGTDYQIVESGVATRAIFPAGGGATFTGTTTTPNLNISTAPTTSGGTYDILTRNTSTGVVEKVLSSTFATTSNALLTTTNQTFTGVKSATNSSANPSGITISNDATATTIPFNVTTLNNTHAAANFGNSANANAVQIVNQGTSGAIGLAVVVNSATGVGVSVGSGGGDNIVSNRTISGNAYVGKNNGTVTYTVSDTGNVTANSFIKTGGTSDQKLNADGSTSTVLSGSASLDFPSTASNAESNLTITVTGAAVGDAISLGSPVWATNTTYNAYVSASNTVTVRFRNMTVSAVDPASATFNVKIFK